VAQQLALVLARHGLVGVHIGAVLDLLAGQRHVHALMAAQWLAHGIGRNQHLAAGQPGAGVDHQVADGPGAVIEEGPLHVADFAVVGNEGGTVEMADAVQHGCSGEVAGATRTVADCAARSGRSSLAAGWRWKGRGVRTGRAGAVAARQQLGIHAELAAPRPGKSVRWPTLARAWPCAAARRSWCGAPDGPPAARCRSAQTRLTDEGT
jgi:hypothetical protein